MKNLLNKIFAIVALLSASTLTVMAVDTYNRYEVEPRRLVPFEQIIGAGHNEVQPRPLASEQLELAVMQIKLHALHLADKIDQLLTQSDVLAADETGLDRTVIRQAKANYLKKALAQLKKSNSLEDYIAWLKNDLTKLNNAIVATSVEETEKHNAKIQANIEEQKDAMNAPKAAFAPPTKNKN